MAYSRSLSGFYRVSSGDQRMRRVKDQGIKRTQGPGPEDQGTKGSGEPKELFFPVILVFFFSLPGS